ncbi:hypothetical protein QR680_010015 [Steinernema hermaphroditum]|uniref:Origin recognition complex subunit 4 n=1 Tax=Steinernema hermaphroditum TaxID=289476 RepID=A0AA39MB00_9BILA|nr:hypothetical protein QR680_010015 [Steinernema hermaphroditum]
MGPKSRFAVGLAMATSGVVIVASLFVVGALFRDINTLYDDLLSDLGEFKIFADDAWKTMMDLQELVEQPAERVEPLLEVQLLAGKLEPVEAPLLLLLVELERRPLVEQEEKAGLPVVEKAELALEQPVERVELPAELVEQLVVEKAELALELPVERVELPAELVEQLVVEKAELALELPVERVELALELLVERVQPPAELELVVELPAEPVERVQPQLQLKLLLLLLLPLAVEKVVPPPLLLVVVEPLLLLLLVELERRPPVEQEEKAEQERSRTATAIVTRRRPLTMTLFAEAMDSIIRPILQRIEGELLGLDDAEKRLSKIISSFAQSHEGGSCLVVGPRQSGKTALIRKVLPLVPADIDTKHINGLLWTEAKAIKLLEQSDNSDDDPKLIVVDNVEHFVAKSNQNLIYKVLDATRTKPWYVIFVTARQDFDELLEKRVRSRLSNIVIKCATKIELDDFCEQFEAFLKAGKSQKKWNALVEQLVESDIVKDRLEALFYERRNYFSLKAVASVFLSFVIASGTTVDDLTVESLSEMLVLAVKSVAPDDQPFLTALAGLSLRPLCLLICVRKLDSIAQGRRAAHSYQQIQRTFLKMVNQFCSMLKVNNGLTLYKDLDHLINLGFLTATTGGQAQMTFRRVRLTFDSELFDDFLRNVKVPTQIRYWIEDVPVK